jgi:hypothetical protein
MASDKSMYWLAAGVLALGISTRYGHGNPTNSWVACAFNRTTEILNRVSDRADSGVDRAVYVAVSRQDCANARAQEVMDRVQARSAELMARREAASARVHAALARIDSRVGRIEIDDDSE